MLAGILFRTSDYYVTRLNCCLLQVVVQMEPSEAYEVAHYIPAPSLPYSQPGSSYTLVRLPDDDPSAGRKVYWDRSGFSLEKSRIYHIKSQYPS